MASDLGTGTTVTFGTSAFAFDLLSVGGPGQSRGSVQTTHMGTTTAHTFTPTDLVDGGEMEVEGAHTGALDPPIDAAAETITIDWGGAGAGSKWTFSGFMTNYNPTAPLEERMTFTATIKVTGAVSVAQA